MERTTAGWAGTWVDQHGLEVIDREAARDLVAGSSHGRVAFCRRMTPVVLPVTHVVDAWDIAFRSSYGTKLQEAAAGHDVAFECDHFEPGVGGWSVLVHGPLEIVRDQAQLERLEARGLESPVLGAQRGRWVRLRIRDISGRRLRPVS